ncbi:unnamed protein product [Acanthoscelides obtectus]|uniref:Uncharacterized protein n=1 Tax=Acanthoscelides obtectus TaxID=200917 RepID=A0A9P0Q3P3_ACAOB|nr:unnamed protein product [Acanthoscelides obtectus]CAK1638580.1 hypothetical protein AOBTE_LOCUS10680 [Acanthoscelides obtectus]
MCAYCMHTCSLARVRVASPFLYPPIAPRLRPSW